MLRATLRTSPSSNRRWVSNIQVEKVVYEPSAAVPSSVCSSPCRTSPTVRPSSRAPLMLTTKVPKGKSRPRRAAMAPST